MATIRLIIEWNGPGTPVNVNGPIQDKLLCYGLLEMARDAISAYVAPPAPQLVFPKVTLPPHFGNGGKGVGA